LSLSKSEGHYAAGRIRYVKEIDDLIGTCTRYLLPCSIVPQLATVLEKNTIYELDFAVEFSKLDVNYFDFSRFRFESGP
jgi:hypothetical protein